MFRGLSDALLGIPKVTAYLWRAMSLAVHEFFCHSEVIVKQVIGFTGLTGSLHLGQRLDLCKRRFQPLV